MQQTSMGDMHDTFWHNDQVIVTFYSDMHVTDITKQSAFDFLDKHRVSLNQFLESHTSLTLSLLSNGDTPRLTGEALRSASVPENVDGSSEPDIYLFKWPSRAMPSISMAGIEVEIQTGLVGFFHIHDASTAPHDMAGTMSSGTEMPQGATADKAQEGVNMNDPRNIKKGPVATIVDLLNGHVGELHDMNSANNVPILGAEPHWYSGGAGDIPQGCPVSPPMPVPVDVSCTSSPGLFPLEFSPGDMSNIIGDSGEGVTVFVLDTLPTREQITYAAREAGEDNKLLLEVEQNVKFCYDYDSLVDAVDKSGRLAVGKDIFGRHGHFRLSDHGLFITGIVHSLAPKADIECIRVLNDFCVGDMKVLLRALQDIHNRMMAGGDLYGKPVVISMSLVIPTDEEAMQMGITLDAKNHNMIRTSLFSVIESLAELGAIFVASAGNEGDMRDNPSGMTPKPLYPAAFADDDGLAVISVGSTDGTGKPTTYSCFPGINGIAVYGGALVQPISSSGCFTKAIATDALIGIYSSLSYPSLSIDDCEPDYPAPNNKHWAYWAGTSFSTPIISAVLARILQIAPLAPNRIATLVPISNAVAASPITWKKLSPLAGAGAEYSGRMIHVSQCKGETTGQG